MKKGETVKVIRHGDAMDVKFVKDKDEKTFIADRKSKDGTTILRGVYREDEVVKRTNESNQ